ncbi:hypothetical protein ACXJJ3_08890 [Kribbella sp. WER1]|uniref:hypothetical protein n=1 Tax=Kribbella sp. NPDC059898 TaxID=3346995 RepID=UPI0036486C74
MSADYVDALFYAQVEPIWAYNNGLAKSLRGARVARLTQSHPQSPIGGTVIVKLALRIPASAFLPLRPAPVVVPHDDAQPVLLEMAQ